MENKLLEALQLAKTGNTLALFQWKEKSNAEKMIADINDLLLKQREKSAEEVPLSYKLHESLKENIINAKLI